MAQDLFRRFSTRLQRSNGILLQGRVLVAVSGGGDSVALLDLLCRLADETPLELVVAHLDHGLRPRSLADADFVKRLAESLELPALVERIDITALLPTAKGGVEEVARTVRREFLENCARARACDWIALGHHMDDQAETFLLRLLRGTGPPGLSGMRMNAPPYVRPLLGFSRDELRQYLADRRLPWREDETNTDLDRTRNRVRHELLPLLRSFNPNIVEHLARLCRRFADDEDCWRQVVAREAGISGREVVAGGIALPCELLRWLPAAFSGRLIRAALEQVRGNLRQVRAVHVAMVQALVDADKPQAEIHLPGAWVARRYEQLWFRQAPPAPPGWKALVVAGPGTYPLPNGCQLLVECNDAPLGEEGASVEFCADQVTFPLQIRTVSPGDRLQPAGMPGSRKLQDLYVDLKLVKEQRQTQPLVCRGDRILWVVGLRRCAGAHPQSGGANKVLRMTCLGADKALVMPYSLC